MITIESRNVNKAVPVVFAEMMRSVEEVGPNLLGTKEPICLITHRPAECLSLFPCCWSSPLVSFSSALKSLSTLPKKLEDGGPIHMAASSIIFLLETHVQNDFSLNVTAISTRGSLQTFLGFDSLLAGMVCEYVSAYYQQSFGRLTHITNRMINTTESLQPFLLTLSSATKPDPYVSEYDVRPSIRPFPMIADYAGSIAGFEKFNADLSMLDKPAVGFKTQFFRRVALSMGKAAELYHNQNVKGAQKAIEDVQSEPLRTLCLNWLKEQQC